MPRYKKLKQFEVKKPTLRALLVKLDTELMKSVESARKKDGYTWKDLVEMSFKRYLEESKS